MSPEPRCRESIAGSATRRPWRGVPYLAVLLVSLLPTSGAPRATASVGGAPPGGARAAGAPTTVAPAGGAHTAGAPARGAPAAGAPAAGTPAGWSASPAQAGAEPPEKRLFAGRTYDPGIPSPTEFLGYGPGEFHTQYPGMVRYFDELATRSDRIDFDDYGTSYEHRPLYRALVGSEANLRRVDDIRAALDRLAHPGDLDEATAAALLASTPAVVFLNYGTHGDETAAFEASMHTAWQLVAATDAETVAMLDELLVVITPALNPDGHERFVAWYNSAQVGAEGSAGPAAAEHFAPWGVSTTNNHYQINLNREAAWSTQVEEQAILRLYMEWNPQVFVDHHGNPEEFIGPWNAEPLNPEITADQRDWMVRYGEDMAAMFEEQGFRYTPWEFGLMYPGYWDSFPLLNGAIAFTLESGGGGWKGLSFRTRGGHVTTFEDGVVQHVIADQSVLRVTAAHREEKLRAYLEYKRSAIAEAVDHPVQAYALSADNDPARLDTVVNLMLRNDVEVLRTTAGLELDGAVPYPSNDAHEPPGVAASGAGAAGSQPQARASPAAPPSSIASSESRQGSVAGSSEPGGVAERIRLPAGSYVLPMAQPQARLLRALMAPDTEFPSDYLAQVEENRRRAESPGFPNPNIWTTTEPFYDITAWSIPLTYHLKAWQLPGLELGAGEPVQPPVEPSVLSPVVAPVGTPGRFDNPGARHAFIFDHDSNRAVSAIAWLRRQGLGFHIATAAFRVGERRFGPGAVVVYRHENQDVDLGAMMRRLVDDTGVELLGVDRNLTDEGPHLGSDQFVEAVPGRIGVVIGGPVRPSSWGEIWFLMERLHGVEFTALWFDELADIDLRDYGVLVFPDGFYWDIAARYEERLARSLRRWVQEGGSLVALKGAAAWMARPELGLSGVRVEEPYVGKSIFMTDGGHPPLPPQYEEPAEGAAGPGGDAGAASAEQLTVQTVPMIHGAILRARVFPHWLSYGYVPRPRRSVGEDATHAEIPVMMWSNLALMTPPGAAAPVYFVEAERMLMAGFAFPDSLGRLEGTAYLVDEPLGSGHVILFADDPAFRLFWDGLTRLFFNAVFFSNSF